MPRVARPPPGTPPIDQPTAVEELVDDEWTALGEDGSVVSPAALRMLELELAQRNEEVAQLNTLAESLVLQMAERDVTIDEQEAQLAEQRQLLIRQPSDSTAEAMLGPVPAAQLPARRSVAEQAALYALALAVAVYVAVA